MKKSHLILAGTIVVLALAVFLSIWRAEPRQEAMQPESPVTQQAASGPELGEPEPAAPPPVAESPPEPPAPSIPPVPPASAMTAKPTAAVLPEPSERFTALLTELRPNVDAALRASDFQAADRLVDEVLASSDLDTLEKQRLMVVKLGTRGMRGDHAAMLELMDEIIAVDPATPLAAKLSEERPKIARVQQLGPDHPDLCETCGQAHPPGQHQAEEGARPAAEGDPPQE